MKNLLVLVALLVFVAPVPSQGTWVKRLIHDENGWYRVSVPGTDYTVIHVRRTGQFYALHDLQKVIVKGNNLYYYDDPKHNNN